MEPLESYCTRFWTRFRKDATPWARDNIIWGVIVLVVPPIAAYLRDSHAPIDWVLIKNSLWLYGFALSIYFLTHLCRTPKKLDDDRELRERRLSAVITERDQAIATFSAKPKRTAAQQHDLGKVKKALQMFKGEGLIALRHIRAQRTLAFGAPGSSYIPALPSGLSMDRALWIYRHCASEGILNGANKNNVEILTVPERMDEILDEALFVEE